MSTRLIGLNEEVITEIFEDVPHMGQKTQLKYQIEMDALKD